MTNQVESSTPVPPWPPKGAGRAWMEHYVLTLWVLAELNERCSEDGSASPDTIPWKEAFDRLFDGPEARALRSLHISPIVEVLIHIRGVEQFSQPGTVPLLSRQDGGQSEALRRAWAYLLSYSSDQRQELRRSLWCAATGARLRCAGDPDRHRNVLAVLRSMTLRVQGGEDESADRTVISIPALRARAGIPTRQIQQRTWDAKWESESRVEGKTTLSVFARFQFTETFPHEVTVRAELVHNGSNQDVLVDVCPIIQVEHQSWPQTWKLLGQGSSIATWVVRFDKPLRAQDFQDPSLNIRGAPT